MLHGEKKSISLMTRRSVMTRRGGPHDHVPHGEEAWGHGWSSAVMDIHEDGGGRVF